MAGQGQGRLVRGRDQAGGHRREAQATWGQRCCLGPGSNLSNSAPFLGGTVRFRVHLPAEEHRPAALKAPGCRGPAPWGSPAPGSTCSRPHPLPHPAPHPLDGASVWFLLYPRPLRALATCSWARLHAASAQCLQEWTSRAVF